MNANYGSSSGSTALHCAAVFGSKDVCEVLLNRNDINPSPINIHNTTLDAAIGQKKDDIIALLVEKGATANKYYQDEDGKWKEK